MKRDTPDPVAALELPLLHLVSRAVLVFGAGFGLLFAALAAIQGSQEEEALALAQPVAATIVEARVVEHHGTSHDRGRTRSSTSFQPHVRFRYQAAGRSHESTRWSAGGTPSRSTRAEAAELLRPYPVGAEVEAWLLPDAQDAGVLRREGSNWQNTVFVGLLFVPVAWAMSAFLGIGVRRWMLANDRAAGRKPR